MYSAAVPAMSPTILLSIAPCRPTYHAEEVRSMNGVQVVACSRVSHSSSVL